ncbi:MAG TPA: heparinase II/III family protein [Saprospiraceae bacterium]|nr:heparinase II/III family protein [Saprospiraceae bacterium]
MPYRFALLSSLFSILFFSFSQAQDVSKEAIASAIDFDRLEHPYLFFDKSGLKEIKKNIKNDVESGELMTRLLTEANSLLYMPVDAKIPERGTHVRAGWSEIDRANEYERKLRAYSSHAQHLAFVYQITGEEEYAQKAFDFAEVVCQMPVWVLQAHEFPIIYSRVMPWNVPDNQVNFNFDIRTAGLGESIACVYDWTYEALEDWQRDRIRGALLEKVITPVRGDYEFHWWATSYRCNWTGVCNGGLGITAIALLKDHPTLIDVVAESYNRINKMMNEIGVDGGWQEGGGYLHYGLRHATRFAVSLKEASGGQFNLFKNERLSNNPASFLIYLNIPPNRAVNFGDSKDRINGSTDFFNLLTNETNSQEAAWYRNHILGRGRNVYDLIFPRPAMEGTPPENPSRHFKSIDWWVMRSDFTDVNKVFLAGKAGKNNDPHHGHLDIGHFVLYWKGQAFLKDSGQPYYDEEYFDETRWQYPQAASAGHNVIMVNGEQQVPGKLKNQPFNHEIGGKVIEFKSTKKRDYVRMDPSNAYPKKELRKWQRHIVLEKPNITLLLDDIETQKNGALVDLRFHTEVEEQINRDGFAMLKGNNDQMALIPTGNNPVQFYQDQHAYQPVHGTKPFEWLPYFGLHTRAEKAQNRTATLILPVEDEQEAKSIQSSLKMLEEKEGLLIQFKYRGEKYAYHFHKNQNGLQLD